jgi:hypothetical protein
LNNAFIAIIGQGDGIDLRWTIAPVEQGFFFLGCTPGAHQTGADGHQITLFGRQAGVIPIDNVQGVVGIDQDVAGVNIGMTQNKFRGARQKYLSQPLGAPDEIENLNAFGL